MLEIILILLGLLSPNADVNTQTTDNQDTTITVQNSAPSDTGGETPVPPKDNCEMVD